MPLYAYELLFKFRCVFNTKRAAALRLFTIPLPYDSRHVCDGVLTSLPQMVICYAAFVVIERMNYELDAQLLVLRREMAC